MNKSIYGAPFISNVLIHLCHSPLSLLNIGKSSCCPNFRYILAKTFKLYCLQRKNCQTTHAAKHYSEQETFFDKMKK